MTASRLPQLSVICPTYNRSALLRECAESVLTSLNSVEMVIVDDCSSDDTTAACEQIRSRFGHDRVAVHRLNERSGAQRARNEGVQVASGEMIMFVDSDDVVISSGVARLQGCLLDRAELDFVYGRVMRTDEALVPLDGAAAIGERYSGAPVEIAGYHWHTMGAIYRRAFLDRIGPWNDALTGAQDWEFQARAKLAAGQFEYVDAVVGFWRQHDHERVGTRYFRPDYVRSVMKACASILQCSRDANTCDAALERRLAAKLVVHALELGANGDVPSRSECLQQAARCLTDNAVLRTCIDLLRFTPATFDQTLWHAWIKRQTGISAR